MKIQELAYSVIEETCGDLDGRQIAEIGTGRGELSRRLGGAGAEVTGVDLDIDESLEGVTHHVQHDLGDGQLPLPDASFDCVVSTEVIEHLRAPFVVLSSMVRVLKPGGVLVLTMPNYWNLKYRVRYLLSGNIPRPTKDNDKTRTKYLRGIAPHINVLTYPTLRTILAWEGCTDFELQTVSRFSTGQMIRSAPWYALVKLSSLFFTPSSRKEYRIDEMSSPRVLLGKHRILLKCRKNGVVGAS